MILIYLFLSCALKHFPVLNPILREIDYFHWFERYDQSDFHIYCSLGSIAICLPFNVTQNKSSFPITHICYHSLFWWCDGFIIRIYPAVQYDWNQHHEYKHRKTGCGARNLISDSKRMIYEMCKTSVKSNDYLMATCFV